MEGKEFLTVNDIAVELGVSKRKIRELLSSGAIPARKIGVKYITTTEALRKYINKGAGQP